MMLLFWLMGPGVIPLPDRVEEIYRIAESKDALYIIDRVANTVWKIGRLGKVQASYSKRGSGPGEFARPTQIRFYQDQVILCDPVARKIIFFHSDLTFDSEWRQERLCQEVLLHQDRSYLVSFDPTTATTVQVFNASREHIGAFGSGLAADPVLAGAQVGRLLELKNSLYWFHSQLPQIEIFTNGEHQKTIQIPGFEGPFMTRNMMLGRNGARNRYMILGAFIVNEALGTQIIDYQEKRRWLYLYNLQDQEWKRIPTPKGLITTGKSLYTVELDEDDFPQTLTHYSISGDLP